MADDVNDINLTVTGEDDGATVVLDKVAQGGVKVAEAMDDASAATDRLVQSQADLASTTDIASAATSDNTKVTGDNAAVTADATRANEDSTAVLATRASAYKTVNAQVARHSLIMDAANERLTTTQRALNGLSSMGTPAIFKAATWAALGAGGVAYLGISRYMQFQREMTQIVTQAGVPAIELPQLSKEAMTISKQTGININDIANTMYRVASGTASWNKGLGGTAKQIGTISKQVSDLNLIGNIPAGAASEQSSRVVTALLNANMRGVGRGPISAAALINAAVGAGDIRQQELISAMGRGVLVSGKNIGASAKDILSWIDLMTSFGTTGSVAGTYVRTGLTQLAAQSVQGTKAFGMIGIKPGDVEKIVSGPQGILGAVNFINAHLKKWDPVKNYPAYENSDKKLFAPGSAAAAALLQDWTINQFPQAVLNQWKAGHMTPEVQKYVNELLFVKTFGGARQMIPMSTLLNNVGTYEGISSNIGRHDTVANYESAVRRASSTPQVQFHKALQSINVDLIQIGKDLTPVFLKLADALSGFVGFLTSHTGLLQTLAYGLAAVVGVAGVSKVAGFISKDIYPMFGSMYTMRNATLGRLFGSYNRGENSWELNARGNSSFGKGFTGRGGAFLRSSQAEYIKTQGAAADLMFKAGQLQLQAAETDATAADENVGSSARSMGGGGGMMMGGLSPAERRAAREEQGLISDLSSNEASALSYFTGRGKMVSKSGIAAWLRDPSTGGGKQVASQELVNRMYNKIAPLQDATGEMTQTGKYFLLGSANGGMSNDVAGAAASAGEAAAPVAEDLVATGAGAALSEGTGMTLGGLAGGALGMLGGPMGMMAGMMVAPMVMPYITSGLRGLFGDLFGGSTPEKISSATTRIVNNSILTGGRGKHSATAAQKAALATQRRELALLGSGRPSDWINYFRQGKNARMYGALAVEYAKNPQAYLNNLGYLAYSPGITRALKQANYIVHDGYVSSDASILRDISDPVLRAKIAHIFTPGDPRQAQLALQAMRKSARSELLATPGSVAQQNANRLYSLHQMHSTTGAQLGAYSGAWALHRSIGSNSHLGIPQAMGDYGAVALLMMHLAQYRKLDLSKGTGKGDGKGLTEAVRKGYEQASSKLEDRIKELHKTEQDILKGGDLSDKTVNALAEAMSLKLGGVYTQLGLTQTGFENAMKAAFNMNAFEAAIGQAVATKTARRTGSGG